MEAPEVDELPADAEILPPVAPSDEERIQNAMAKVGGLSKPTASPELPAADEEDELPSDAEALPSVDEKRAEDAARVRHFFEFSADDNPDEEAEILRFASRTKMDRDVAKAHWATLKKTWGSALLNPERWMDENPDLARLVLDRPELGSVVTKDKRLSAIAPAWNALLDADKAIDDSALGDAADAVAKGIRPAQDMLGVLSTVLPVLTPLATLETREERSAAREGKRLVAGGTQEFRENAETAYLADADPVTRVVAIAAGRYSETKKAAVDTGNLYASVWRARRTGDEDEVLRLQGKIANLERESMPLNYGEGRWEQVVGDIASSMGTNIPSIIASVEGAGAGALVAGVAVGAATRDPAKAWAAAKFVAPWTARGAGFASSYNMELGNSYAELLKTKTDDGRPLPENLAAAYAHGYAVLAAGVEVAGGEVVARSLGRLLKGSAGMARGEVLKGLIRSPDFKRFALQAFRGVGASGLSEGLEETTQGRLGELSDFAARTDAAGKVQTFNGASVNDMLVEFEQAAVGVGGTSIGPAVIAVGMEKARIEGVLRGAKTVEIINQLQDSPTVRGAPEAVAELIARETAKTGEEVTHLYLDPEAFVTLFQGENDPSEAARTVVQAATELLGEDGPKRLQEATLSGENIAIPTKEYLERLGASPAAQQLAGDITTRPNRKTPNQEKKAAAEAQQNIDTKVRDYLARLEKGEDIPVGDSAALDALEQQLVETGKASKGDARRQVLVWRAFSETMATRFETTPDELFQYLVSVNLKNQQGQPIAMAAAPPSIEAVDDGQLMAAQGEDPFGGVSLDESPDRAALRAAYNAKDEADRREALHTDRNTGLYNERGFAEIERPADRPMLAKFGLAGSKFLNDKHGHDTVNGALRLMAVALEKADIHDGAKVGGDVEVYVRDEAHAAQLAALMESETGEDVTFGVETVGEDMETVRKSAGEKAGAMRAARGLGHRQGIPTKYLPANAPAVKWGDDITEGVDAESPEAAALIEAAKVASAESAKRLREGGRRKTVALNERHAKLFDDKEGLDFEEIVFTPAGTLTEYGFHLARETQERAFAASADLRGIRAMNDEKTGFGKQGTNQILRWFDEAFAAIGGEFFPAHPHGDEFAAQHDVFEDLLDVFKALKQRTDKVVFWAEQASGGVVLQKGLQFAYGIDADFVVADRDKLAENKKAQGKVNGPRLFQDERAAHEEIHALVAAGYQPVRVSLEGVADQGSERSAGEGSSGTGSQEGGGRTFADEDLAKARAHIGRMRKDRKALALSWLAYVLDPENVPRPPILPPKDILADLRNEFGIADPQGEQIGRNRKFARSHKAKRHGDAAVRDQDFVDNVVRRDKSSVGTFKVPRNPADPEADTEVTTDNDDGETLEQGPLLGEWTLEQPAFHGTPHRFEKFSLQKIGTGEGAQAYGWGLYFASAKEVAEHYRRSLSDARVLLDDKGIDEHENPTIRATLKSITKQVNGERGRFKAVAFKEAVAAQLDLLDSAKRSAANLSEDAADDGVREAAREEIKEIEEAQTWLTSDRLRLEQGQLFEVDVPEADDLLDYDATLMTQPRSVLEKLDALLSEHVPRHPENGLVRLMELSFGTGRQKEYADLEDELIAPSGERIKNRHGFGGRIYRQIADGLGGEQAASEALRRAGIPGLRYLDAASRDDGQGSRNFVIWDDSRVKVEKTFYQDEAATDPRGFIRFLAFNDPRTQGSPRSFKITLGDKADKSTFLHESGHAFLEMFADLAARPDAPEGVRNDFVQLLKWFGVEKREDIEEPHHEKFARAFETYLRDGKSPSAYLRRAFARFRIWLTRIYPIFEPEPLPPDIRDLFDRLLATDAEIRNSKRRAGLQPMFRTQEEAGMTPEQWQAYLAEQEEATSHAVRQADLALAADQLRETQGWWKEEVARLEEAFGEEYENLPARRAQQFVRNDKLKDVRKMDRDAVIRDVGKDNARKFPTEKGGARPDEVASLHGYPTGKAMLEAIIALPAKDAWVAERADEQMREKHGDILKERDRLAGVVDGGLQGDHTAKWLMRELVALKAKMRPAFSKTAEMFAETPLDVIARAARQMVDDRTLKGLDPGRVLAAERRAAEGSLKAATEGRFAQAFVLKEQQILNLFLHRELTAAKDEREKLLDLASALSEEKARAKAGKAGAVYRGGIDMLLETFGLKAPSARDEALPSLNEVVSAMEADAATVLFDPDVISKMLANPPVHADGRRKGQPDFGALTVAQMRELHIALKSIRTVARNKLKAIVDGKKVEREGIIANLLAEAAQNLPDLGAFSSTESAKSRTEKGATWFAGIDGELLRPATMLGWLGGRDLASTWFKAITEPMRKAKHREADLMKGTIKPILDAFQKMPKSVRASFMDNVDGAALFPSHREDLQAPTRRFELLMMALNAGNESNLERLLDGRTITREQLAAALNLLTADEIGWVNAVHKAAESLWPETADLEERDTGIRPKKIETRPFAVNGGVIQGYFPAIYDRRAENIGETQAARQVADLMDPSFTRGGTPHSHTKKRATHFSGALSLEPGNIPSHLAQVAHDIAFRETVKSVGSLLLDQRVQAAMKRRLGDPRARLMVQWVKDVGQMRSMAGVVNATVWTKALRQLRTNTVAGVLGYSLKTALGDIANVIYAAVHRKLKTRFVTEGIGELLRNRAEAIAFAEGKSGELRFRRDQLQREFMKQIESLTATGPFARGPLAWFKEHAFVFMEYSDKLTSTPIWLGAYRQALAEGKSDTDAVTFADDIIQTTFPSHSAVDASAILRDRGFVGSSLMFYSYLNVVWNERRDIVHDMHLADGKMEKAKALPRVMARLFALQASTMILGSLISRGGDDAEEGEDGEEKAERWLGWFLRKMAMAQIEDIPFGGDVASAAEAAWWTGKRVNARTSPAMAAAEGIGRAVLALTSEDMDKPERAKAVLRGFGPVFGIPSAAPVRALDYVTKAANDDAPAEDVGDVAKGVVYGAPRR